MKKAPVKVEGNLMFTQRNNPYCELLSSQKYKKKMPNKTMESNSQLNK